MAWYQRMGVLLTIHDAYGTTQLILPEQVSSGLGGVTLCGLVPAHGCLADHT